MTPPRAPGAVPIPDRDTVAGLEVKRVPLHALHVDPSNARIHPDVNIDAIVGSLRRFGQAEPLVVQSGTGRIVAGNGRYVAMKRLGWTECDVVEIAVDDATATALAIALNRTAALAEWDEPNLARLLESLRDDGALEGVGFSEEDLDSLLDEIARGELGEDDKDVAPALLPNAVSLLSDLWRLGDHRLLCGDSTKAEDLARLMAGEKAVLWATDPPYSVDYTGNNRRIDDGKRAGKDWSHVYHEIEDLGAFLDGTFRASLPHLREDAPVYLSHANLQQPVVAKVFEAHGILFHQVIIWVKPGGVFGHSYYQWQHEPCAFGWRKGHKPKQGIEKFTTVWQVDWEGKQRVLGNEHPTQKPLRLFEIPMEQHTRPGDVVLETFSGSGSQIVAAEKLRRRCRAMEIEPAFVDVAIRRWEKATGKEAVLDETGKTFAEVAAERGVSLEVAS